MIGIRDCKTNIKLLEEFRNKINQNETFMKSLKINYILNKNLNLIKKKFNE
jgi:hypothetical protein